MAKLDLGHCEASANVMGIGASGLLEPIAEFSFDPPGNRIPEECPIPMYGGPDFVLLRD